MTPLENRLKQIVEKPIKNLGFELKRIYLGSENGKKALFVIIQSEKGVTINNCTRVSRIIDPILETADPIKGNYTLIVSSPGVKE